MFSLGFDNLGMTVPDMSNIVHTVNKSTSESINQVDSLSPKNRERIFLGQREIASQDVEASCQ